MLTLGVVHGHVILLITIVKSTVDFQIKEEKYFKFSKEFKTV